MKTIVETETKDYDFFGRYGTVTSQTGITHVIQIDDETEDFDYPKDYDNWITSMKNKLRKEGRYYG